MLKLELLLNDKGALLKFIGDGTLIFEQAHHDAPVALYEDIIRLIKEYEPQKLIFTSNKSVLLIEHLYRNGVAYDSELKTLKYFA